jgi:RNA-binding protein
MLDNSRMSSLTLTPTQRRSLRAQAHHLEPVVAIGQGGLSPAIQAEVDAALAAHALIKVKASSDDRNQRAQWLEALCQCCHAAAVQHIGKLLVLWRPLPPPEASPSQGRPVREVKVVRNSGRGGQRPEVRRVKLVGNQRLTASGQVKRRKTRQVSNKKVQLQKPSRTS